MNECVVDTTHFDCTPVGGEEQVLDSDFTATMTGSGNIYTASTPISRPGKITIGVYKLAQHHIYAEYYPNINWTPGTSDYSDYQSSFDFDWGSGKIYKSDADNVGIQYKFYIKPSSGGSYQFFGLANNYMKMVCEFEGDSFIAIEGHC